MIDTALHFSGGKDSLACLYLNEHRWDEIYVVWLNTGSAYPEIVEYMSVWKEVLPHFVEITSNQPKNIQDHGWPTDVVPVNNTELGRYITGSDAQLMQPYLSCCATNIWFPLHKGTVDLGVKKVIKGQRRCDGRKSAATSGTRFDGLEYEMPIEDWSDADVWSFLEEKKAVVPPGYALGEKTGRDCWDCTAFLDDNGKRIENLPYKKKAEIKRRLGIIDAAVREQWRPVG